MKKCLIFAVSVAIVFLFILFLIVCSSKSENYITKQDQELGYVIRDLDKGEIFSVSNATHAYLFKRLKERMVYDKKGLVEIGLLVYSAREIKNGYALEPYDNPSEYHLEITQKSFRINPAGQFLDMLFIKKVDGPYYNK